MMELETLEQWLRVAEKTKLITDLKTDPDKYGFNRTFEFDTRGKHYKIVWFTNVSTLYIGEFELKFDSICIDGCYPNGFRTNINFRWNDKTIGVLPIEEY